MDFWFSKRTCLLFLNISYALIFSFFLATHLNSYPSKALLRLTTLQPIREDACKDLKLVEDRDAKCSYLHLKHPCVPQAYIDYLKIFYCACGGHPALGFTLLVLWLLVLFYLLGNTASQYFCSSLASLSRLLRLPPTIAGVTLLALGNGAPDVFASVVSFAGSDGGDVGLSSVLGGVFFVSSVVVGIISIGLSSRSVIIDRRSFVRDICFLLLVLSFLLVILVTGEIGIWRSIAFFSLYIVYVLLVWTDHGCKENLEDSLPIEDPSSLCKAVKGDRSKPNSSKEKHGELAVPLLDSLAIEDPDSLVKGVAGGGHWMSNCWSWVFYLLEMPLYLPRRLTIPDVSDERWSKPFSVASVSLAPLLLATLWISQREDMSTQEVLIVSLSSCLAGILLGIVAMETTEQGLPPKRFLIFWLGGGFLMSVVWAYMIARELVALLVSMGYILGISPLVLGLTVLAWGNSLGDLMANVAMAVHGGGDGVHIAITGCYAGPIFNTLVGLGLSLVLASGATHPYPLVIPRERSLFETIGFLVGGLLWALVVLPSRGMKPDKVLGIGLLAIYASFLCSRLFSSFI